MKLRLPKEAVMKAGRELDALVAEKVMGMERTEDPWTFRWRYPEPTRGMRIVYIDAPDPSRAWNLFQPSTDIKAAWEVVEKLGEEFEIDLTWRGFGWFVTLRKHGFEGVIDNESVESMPHAICLAALKAKEIEV